MFKLPLIKISLIFNASQPAKTFLRFRLLAKLKLFWMMFEKHSSNYFLYWRYCNYNFKHIFGIIKVWKHVGVLANKLNVFNGPSPVSVLFYFWSFSNKHYLFTTNWRQKCPSSILYWDSNPQNPWPWVFSHNHQTRARAQQR